MYKLITILFISMFACTGSHVKPTMYCQKFKIKDIKKVVFRAEQASKAEIIENNLTNTITICGWPNGGAKGYHPSDQNWKETPPSRWGLKFKGKRFGNILVISSVNEIQYIHHYYYFDKLLIRKPGKLVIQLENRNLNGNGKENLGRP